MKARRRRVLPRLVAALWATTLVAGCAPYTASLRPTDKASPDRAYIYGRFQIHAKRAGLGMDGHQTMGFVIRCDHGIEYTVRFSLENRVQVIGVKPAYCALAEIVFTDADGFVRKHRRVLDSGFALAGGTAYYLGDYVAESTFKSTWTVSTMSWLLTAADDNYAATTADMKRTFTNLTGLSTENQMRWTHMRGPGDALRDAMQDAPDDVVSPDRAARLAGFTRRRYATLPKCQAACPKNGECFPFRGEGGSALTCVVRCKADKDCPQGLACNCPDGDGVACRAITSTPEDRMEGICLSVEPASERR